MSLAEQLRQRGFIHQYSAPTLEELLDGEPRTIYHGIDPSADSAHVGNFVLWMLLYHLAQAGHRVVFLVGGGTGRIGDPKPDTERTLKSYEEIDANVTKLRQQAERLFAEYPLTFANNQDWLGQLPLIPFLRDIGKHFTVNELLKKDAIATRLQSETGLSYTEFAYPLLQGYDYLELYRRYGCTIQVGGSDQWGNMVAGIDLIRRLETAEAHVITVPLVIDKVTGKKFGKSEGNAVWLDAQKTTPYQFYQFWYNTSDENLDTFLKLFTTLSLSEIEGVLATHHKSPEDRLAQGQLAYAVTTFVHGREIADACQNVSQVLFGNLLFSALAPNEQSLVLAHAPTVVAHNGTSLIDVLVQAGLAQSKREARTFIAEGAVMVQGVRCTDDSRTLHALHDGDVVHLKRGKRQVVLVTLHDV